MGVCTMADEALGWCEVGISKWQTTKSECDEVGGQWREDEPTICVVATKAYGSALDENVIYLRKLRDRVVGRDPTAARLWKTYWPAYMKMAMPLVSLMGKDPVVRQLVATLFIDPALQALRTAGTHLDPHSNDASVREGVRDGLSKLTEGLKTLAGQDGNQLAEIFLRSLVEVQIDEARERRQL
jgi:hypothetical protein